MKIRVSLKDPDTMHDAVDDALKHLAKPANELDDEEWGSIREDRAERIKADLAERWMEWSEYLVVEFDTEANTATVIPVKDLK